MPHFCECGADEYICQNCGKIECSKENAGRWMYVTRLKREGNVCTPCIKASIGEAMQNGNPQLAEKLKQCLTM